MGAARNGAAQPARPRCDAGASRFGAAGACPGRWRRCGGAEGKSWEGQPYPVGNARALRGVTRDIGLALLRRGAARMPHPILVCGDGTRLPFRDDTFDAVVMVHALEHIPAAVRTALAGEIKRVSRCGVVIHGPAGEDAVRLSELFIAALVARGAEI